MHVRSDVAIVKGGEVSAILTTEPEGKGSFLPQLFSVSPLAATRGKDGQLSLEVEASGLDGPPSSILCGFKGASTAGWCMLASACWLLSAASLLPLGLY